MAAPTTWPRQALPIECLAVDTPSHHSGDPQTALPQRQQGSGHHSHGIWPGFNSKLGANLGSSPRLSLPVWWTAPGWSKRPLWSHSLESRLRIDSYHWENFPEKLNNDAAWFHGALKRMPDNKWTHPEAPNSSEQEKRKLRFMVISKLNSFGPSQGPLTSPQSWPVFDFPTSAFSTYFPFSFPPNSEHHEIQGFKYD